MVWLNTVVIVQDKPLLIPLVKVRCMYEQQQHQV